jgi:UDP-glucose 4-epimerase
MNMLVTGGSGFIGSHVVDLLAAGGHEVVNFDWRAPNFTQPARHVLGDIRDTQAIRNAVKGSAAVFHLAAEAKVTPYFEKPVESSDINLLGTISVLEAARQERVGRVLFASTEWVYSNPELNSVDENTPIYPPAPPHLYACSKIMGELACQSYWSLYQLPYTIMRFGIPFGERAWAQTVTPIFLKLFFTGQEITIHGEGDQFRQFVYVRDLAAGIVACLDRAAENQILNLNGQRAITVREVVRTLEDITGIHPRLKQIPGRPGDFKGRNVSSEKAKRLIGWEPRFPYRDAMARYVEWYQAHELSSPA